MRERCACSRGSLSNGGGCVDAGTLGYAPGKSMWMTFRTFMSTTGTKSYLGRYHTHDTSKGRAILRDARRGCHVARTARKGTPAVGGVTVGTGHRIRLSIHQQRSGVVQHLHVMEISQHLKRGDGGNQAHRLASRVPGRAHRSSQSPRMHVVHQEKFEVGCPQEV